LDADPAADPYEYRLRLHILGKAPELPLSPAEFEALKDAKDLLLGTLGLEESIHLVFANFFEYEAVLLRQALSELIYAVGSWSEFQGSIHDINRLLVNLLSGGRGYLDQSSHFLSRRFGKGSSEIASFRRWCTAQYDSKLGYRVMEALRNYAQHRGVAVHHLSHSHWLAGDGPNAPRRNALVPGLLPTRLAEDGGFKAEVLKELLDLEEPVDIRPLVREYVSGLATVHEQLRQSLSDALSSADKLILDAIDRYDQESTIGVVGLAAQKRDASGKVVDSIALFGDIVERRRDLVRRSGRVPHIVGAFTTNEPRSAGRSGVV